MENRFKHCDSNPSVTFQIDCLDQQNVKKENQTSMETRPCFYKFGPSGIFDK